MPISWHGKDFPLNFTMGQDFERPLKTLHVSVSSLYCSRTPKYQKQAPIYIHENLSWKQNWAQDPRLHVAPSFDENRSKQDFGNRFGSQGSSAAMQIQNTISDLPGLEKEPSPAVRGQCSSWSLCRSILHYLLLHPQGSGRTSHRIPQTAKWAFFSYLLCFCSPLEKGKAKHSI